MSTSSDTQLAAARLDHDRAQRAEDLEELTKELELFRHAVSYDLRAPLRAIDGLSRIALEDHSARNGRPGGRQARVNASDASILLVEDNPNDVDLMRLALERNGLSIRIDVARDGREALDYLFAAPRVPRPALILLDLKLPRVDGLEVLRRLKTHARTAAIPVTVLTGSRQHGDLIASYQRGANSYIVKPVNFDEFVAAVRVLVTYWLALNVTPPSFASRWLPVAVTE